MTRYQFARRLRRARENAGLSQAGAAHLLGVAPPRVAEYESGVRIPPTMRLIEMIRTLGLDPDDLFGHLDKEAD